MANLILLHALSSRYIKGFRVFTVPEAATTLWSNGVFLADILACEETRYWFQDTVLK